MSTKRQSNARRQARRAMRRGRMKSRYKKNCKNRVEANPNYYKKQEDMLVNIGTILFLIISVLWAFCQ
jgi:hypothetical protein